ncbi:MAG: MarR family transcriptional regulator [Burkholderiaceae bacterium]|nr:MarR family transcriptional regulator [Burkholderiaceae bacterium]
MSDIFNYQMAPGYLIRRAHQVSVALFAAGMADFDLTPVQFVTLNALMDEPGEDQITLASKVAFDAATLGAVIGRLENKGLLRRDADPQDKRRKLLSLTPAGEQMVAHMKTAVEQVQSRITAPLSDAEAQELSRLLAKLITGHEADFVSKV